jgi:hypothetical protein
MKSNYQKINIGVGKFSILTSRFALLLFIIFTNSANANDGNEAPFGFAWGMSQSQVQNLVKSIKKTSSNGKFSFLEFSKAPKNLSNAEKYVAVFDKQYGLQKLIFASKKIESDIYGDNGKSQYEDLKKAIVNKYGKPTDNAEIVGLHLFKDTDEFYQCLKYDGCGGWLSIWKGTPNIILELNGLSRGVGYIRLTYEGPKWGVAVDESNEEKQKANQSAL